MTDIAGPLRPALIDLTHTQAEAATNIANNALNETDQPDAFWHGPADRHRDRFNLYISRRDPFVYRAGVIALQAITTDNPDNQVRCLTHWLTIRRDQPTDPCDGLDLRTALTTDTCQIPL